MKKMPVLALLVLFFAAFSSTAEQPGADVILVNGKIFTSSPAQPYVEAMAIKGERILAIGTSQQIGALSGSQTKRIDLGGPSSTKGDLYAGKALTTALAVPRSAQRSHSPGAGRDVGWCRAGLGGGLFGRP